MQRQLCLLLVLCSLVRLRVVVGEVSDLYELVWFDDFIGPSLDTSKWDYEINCWGGGNHEQQCYVNDRSTLYIENGKLIFRPIYYPNGYQGSIDGCTDNTQNSCTWVQPTTSARIRTLKSQAWRYGRFEIRAKMPTGNFLWPAIWLLPRDSVYGTWAASGEIDIVEFQGQLQQAYTLFHTLHHGGVWPDNTQTGTTKQYPFNFTDFHVFTLEWTREEINWFVDDIKAFHINLNKTWWSHIGPDPYHGLFYSPFDQYFYMILNLAVGGDFFGKFGKFNGTVDVPTWTDPHFVIDYVRIYQTNVPPTSPGSPLNVYLIVIGILGVIVVVQAIFLVRASCKGPYTQLQ